MMLPQLGRIARLVFLRASENSKRKKNVIVGSVVALFFELTVFII
jgi:hypothetical protein